MKTAYEQAGSYPAPALLGRTIRFLAGAVILYLAFTDPVEHWRAITRVREGWEVPWGVLPVALIALWLLPAVVDRTFTLRWGYRWPLLFGGLVVTAAAFDFVSYGSLWGPPLGWLVLSLMWLVFGLLGLSFIIGAVLATPG